ncbi:hypothetical protein trd_1886 [Thermomicrobium roseum DSM 5159]|uniref:Uncharacterized protein n=1 Tax=Thermomicrobium roseum (strain ATCC 27502 / DSM 5159 / P-2) TaxID=309801 RepID=B9L1Y6_THERP|nr:hypothetical protein trd_1886 [Thermomicrobium roseum DSM 5159]
MSESLLVAHRRDNRRCGSIGSTLSTVARSPGEERRWKR